MINRFFRNSGYFLFYIGICFFLYCSCGGYNLTGGVETTNGISITACNSGIQGKASPGAQIILCDTAYILPQLSPGLFIDTMYVDENGTFIIKPLPDGCYNLIVRNRDSDLGAIIWNIPINSFCLSKYCDSTKYGILGSISGTALAESNNMSSSVVYIRGTALWDSTNTNGIYVLSKVPSGAFRIEAYRKDNRILGPVYYSAIKDSVWINEEDADIRVDLDLEIID